VSDLILNVTETQTTTTQQQTAHTALSVRFCHSASTIESTSITEPCCAAELTVLHSTSHV